MASNTRETLDGSGKEYYGALSSPPKKVRINIKFISSYGHINPLNLE